MEKGDHFIQRAKKRPTSVWANLCINASCYSTYANMHGTIALLFIILMFFFYKYYFNVILDSIKTIFFTLFLSPLTEQPPRRQLVPPCFIPELILSSSLFLWFFSALAHCHHHQKLCDRFGVFAAPWGGWINPKVSLSGFGQFSLRSQSNHASIAVGQTMPSLPPILSFITFSPIFFVGVGILRFWSEPIEATWRCDERVLHWSTFAAAIEEDQPSKPTEVTRRWRGDERRDERVLRQS